LPRAYRDWQPSAGARTLSFFDKPAPAGARSDIDTATPVYFNLLLQTLRTKTMATQALSTAAPGSLAAVGTAAKAFLLTHPIGMSLAGGALLGAGAYWGIGKLLRKKAQAPLAEPAAA
jgi:hypothetical protein